MQKSFFPEKRILLGPGPSNISDRVLAAMSRPTLGHLDPDFIGLMESIKDLLKQTFLTQNSMTLPLSAPGSAGMEACFVNLIEPGDKVIVCQNGVFGGRMTDIAQRCGAQVVLVENDWGQPVDANKVDETVRKNPDAKILAFVHAETSTGVLSDGQTLASIARQNGLLSIVDCVTSLAGLPVRVDDWSWDAVYSGTQKCLSAPPGISPVTFSSRAMEVVEKRKTKPQSWFLDLQLLTGYWGGGQAKRAYHHTAPVNAMYALHESLLSLHQEGLEQSWHRHLEHHKKLKTGLHEIGLEYAVEESVSLPMLNAIKIPESVDDATVRRRMLEEFKIEIGAGLGPMAGKIWRIGLMGSSSTEENIEACLQALKACL